MNQLAKRLAISLPSKSLVAKAPWQRLIPASKPDDQTTLIALADSIELLSACLRGGLPLGEAIGWVQKRSSGFIGAEITSIARAAQTGESTSSALLAYEAEQKNPDLRELALKLALSEQLGTPVVNQLQSLCTALRSRQRSAWRETAAKKESRMMLPLVFLVRPVTVLFAVYPSIQFLQFQTI